MDKTPSQRGKASRRKGKSGEYFVRDWLQRVTGIEWMRTPLSGGFHLSFPWDVMPKRPNQDHAFDRVGIEVKNCKTLKVPEWINQCQEAEMDFINAKIDRWTLFMNVKGEWYAMMPMAQLERFIEKNEK